MTIKEALELLESAPGGDQPSRVNPVFTQEQAVNTVVAGLSELLTEHNMDHELDDLLTKRVHQVCRNQRRPRY